MSQEKENRQHENAQSVQEGQQPHKRRVRYKGRYPKKFEEKYKELQPEKYQDTVKCRARVPFVTQESLFVNENLIL